MSDNDNAIASDSLTDGDGSLRELTLAEMESVAGCSGRPNWIDP